MLKQNNRKNVQLSSLEVVIGLVFIYLLYSLLATTVQELIATWLKLRARMLKKGIKRMLDDGGAEKFSLEFYKHPLIEYFGKQANYMEKKLLKSESVLPSYLSAQNFSKILTEIMQTSSAGSDASAKINQFISEQQKLVNEMPGAARIEKDTLQLLKSFMDEAGADIEKFRLLIEQWFDDMMERVSGWYKRKTQIWLLIIGFSIAIIFNVDTIMITKKLSHDKDAAKALADMASNYVKTNKDTPTLSNSTDSLSSDTLLAKANLLLNNQINDANKILAIGYDANPFKTVLNKDHWLTHILMKLIGWLLTALAISLGAPFWFDLLNKLMKLRNSVKENGGEKGAVKDKATPVVINVKDEAIG